MTKLSTHYIGYCVVYKLCINFSNTFQDYYDRTGKSLTRSSDQTVESLHQEMDKVFRRSNYWVKDPLSPIHGEKLLAGVLHINGYTATQMGLVALSLNQ